MSGNRIRLMKLLAQPIQNGYSPICPETPNGRWVLGLGALNGVGLDLSQKKPAPIDDRRVDNFLLSPGDFLISRSNTLDKVGRVALFKGQIENCSYPDLMMRFRVNVSDIYPEFLEIYLRSSEARRYFQRSASGTSETMVKINKSVVENCLIPLMPLPEQIAIADLVATWDRGIEKTLQLIKAKEQFKFALMQQLLTGKAKLKNFHSDWKEYQLSALFIERKETGNFSQPLLSITRNEGVISRGEVGRKDTSNEDKSGYLRICIGDIGYNTMRMWQGVSGLSSLEGIVSPAYTVCIPKDNVDGEFMAYLFKLQKIINRFYRYSQGLTSDTWNLKFHHFCEVKVTIPDFEEQKAIAQVLRKCDEEKKLFNRKLALLKKQKRGLMQKLLTGEWQVKVPSKVS